MHCQQHLLISDLRLTHSVDGLLVLLLRDEAFLHTDLHALQIGARLLQLQLDVLSSRSTVYSSPPAAAIELAAPLLLQAILRHGRRHPRFASPPQLLRSLKQHSHLHHGWFHPSLH